MKKHTIIRIRGLALLLFMVISFSGMAQKDKELKNTIWKIQAESLAETYELGKTESALLSSKYVQMRQSVNEKNKTVDKKNDPVAYSENVAKNEKQAREQLKIVIDKLVNGDRANEALLLLGSFNSRWDSYTKVLVDFAQNQEQLMASSKSLVEYMKLYLKARRMAEESGERFSGRTASELKGKLDTDLAVHLTADQIAVWDTATQRKKKK